VSARPPPGHGANDDLFASIRPPAKEDNTKHYGLTRGQVSRLRHAAGQNRDLFHPELPIWFESATAGQYEAAKAGVRNTTNNPDEYQDGIRRVTRALPY